MEVICYICYNKTKNFSQNLTEIKSKHSHTPIAEFVSKFLDGYPTNRNLHHQLNCICNECLSKIYAYDWTCIKAKEQEAELRNILLKTESTIKSVQIKGVAKKARGPINPLNGVVHIIDDADYNDGDPVDDKASVRTEMQKYSASESTSIAVAAPEIQKAPVVKVRKITSNIDIKSEPTTMCDIKPTIEKPSATLSQPQQPPNMVAPKVEPPKKGKPIIVRVVKRVPFLKSNPLQATSQPNTATVTTPSSGPSNANETSSKVAQQTTPKTSPVKKNPTEKQIPICKYCDGRFPNQKILQVSGCSVFRFFFQFLIFFLCIYLFRIT